MYRRLTRYERTNVRYASWWRRERDKISYIQVHDGGWAGDADTDWIIGLCSDGRAVRIPWKVRYGYEMAYNNQAAIEDAINVYNRNVRRPGRYAWTEVLDEILALGWGRIDSIIEEAGVTLRHGD